jgi:hypothetical protein
MGNRAHQVFLAIQALLKPSRMTREKRSIKTVWGPLGLSEYRMYSTEAIGTHGCLVFVAYSLLHLTCLPGGTGRTWGLIHTMGDACRQ